MQLSEYIQRLTETLDSEGDHPVVKYAGMGVSAAREPKAGYLRVMSKRESIQRLWQNYEDTELKSSKVIVL